MKILIKILLLLFVSQSANAQLFDSDKKKKPLLKVRKAGPFIGVQQSRYFALEIGAEMQFKKIKLIKPPTHAINMGFDYNFRIKQPILSYNIGYWFKQGRINLTYGVNATFKSDFESNKLGGGPVIGFKLLGFHLQTGYNFIPNASVFENVNQLYISLRYVLVNTRDYTWRKREKKKN